MADRVEIPKDEDRWQVVVGVLLFHAVVWTGLLVFIGWLFEQ